MTHHVMRTITQRQRWLEHQSHRRQSQFRDGIVARHYGEWM